MPVISRIRAVVSAATVMWNETSVSEHSRSLHIEGKVVDSHSTVRHTVGL